MDMDMDPSAGQASLGLTKLKASNSFTQAKKVPRILM